MSKELKHADVIVHMAKNGLESVQFRRGGDETWVTLEDHYRINPLSSPNCEWRIKPKKKLIDWSKMPRGAMTNYGELLGFSGECAACRDVFDVVFPFPKDLRLAEQTQFTYWGGGMCPVPEGVVVEVEFRGDCERFVYSDPSELVGWGEADRKYKYSVIAYRILELADNFTDNPSEAEE